MITGSYGYGEAGLAVEVDNRSDGTYTDTVYVRQGKINETLDQLEIMLDAEDGILNIIEESYEEIIDNNADAIADEEDRLERKRQNLVTYYAEVESLLGYYDEVSASLDSQIAQLE